MNQAHANPARIRLLAFGCGLLPLAFLVQRFRFVCDDAFITFRYARNLAHGLGPVYNPAPERPVEGYSEFLWMLWLALLDRLGADIVLWAQVTSVTCALVLLWRVVAFTQANLDGGPQLPVGAALVLATLPPIAVWATGGMATLPFALTLFLMFESLFRRDGPRPVPAAALAVVAALLRADGFYWVACALGVAFLMGRAAADRRLQRVAVTAGASVVVALGAQVMWRMVYYGDALPNTARAKLAFSTLLLERGFDYLMSLLLTFPGVPLLLLGALFTLRGADARVTRPALAMFAGTAAYCVLVGGDFMTMGRFLVPGLPYVAVLAAALLARLGPSLRWASAAVALVVALDLAPAFDRCATPMRFRRNFHFRWGQPAPESEFVFWEGMKRRAEHWSAIGRALRIHSKPGESLVADAIGAIGYYSGLVIYDQRGLVSREVTRLPPLATPQSAGHDRLVGWHFFDAKRPTYLHASLEPAWDSRPTRSVEAGEDGQSYVVEAYPLDGYPGFPKGHALVLLRDARHAPPRP